MTKQIQALNQSQKLAMTTNMHQSISILQMSNTELLDFAAEELGKNPFLEENNTVSDPTTSALKNKSLQRNLPAYSTQDLLDNIIQEKSLKEHIIDQINLSFSDQQEILIAHFLTDYLNQNGYLSIQTNEAAAILRCEQNLVEAVLEELQQFDPTGIFARSLKECLLLQLKEYKQITPALKLLIDNIDMIANGQFLQLSKLCNVDIHQIGDLVKQIKSLNPKPASGFLIEATNYKLPDVYLYFDDQGNFRLETNHNALPSLRVNEEYYSDIRNNNLNKQDSEFVKQEIETAQVVVKSIEQRSSTILKVAAAIIEEQLEFFKHGIMHLKPMTLNKIAATTGFNESTISRSTANKYMSTPFGIYELKYFFSPKLSTNRAALEDVSSIKAQELIKQIVLSEDDEILSDDEIASQLAHFNINIARRTVAKYREKLNIPTSATRKRQALLKV